MENSLHGSTPWWGRAQNIIWTLGPVTVAFFVILAVGLGWFPSPVLQSMTETMRILDMNQRLIQEIRVEVSDHNREFRNSQLGLLKALRQICRNTAKSPQQNERCDEM